METWLYSGIGFKSSLFKHGIELLKPRARNDMSKLFYFLTLDSRIEHFIRSKMKWWFLVLARKTHAQISIAQTRRLKAMIVRSKLLHDRFLGLTSRLTTGNWSGRLISIVNSVASGWDDLIHRKYRCARGNCNANHNIFFYIRVIQFGRLATLVHVCENLKFFLRKHSCEWSWHFSYSFLASSLRKNTSLSRGDKSQRQPSGKKHRGAPKQAQNVWYRS